MEATAGILAIIVIVVAFILITVVWATILLIPPALMALMILRYARGLEEAEEQEEADKERIRSSGHKAQALVLKLKGMDGNAEGDQKLDLVLKITRKGSKPYGARITASVPRIYLPQLQPGRAVPVFVDRDEPKRVVLDIEGLGRIRAIPGGGLSQVCAYCKGVFPADAVSCPHCQAPVREG